MLEDKDKFIKDFFEEHKFIFKSNNHYITDNVIQNSSMNKGVLVGTLYKRIKSALIKYVDGDLMSEEEFYNSLSIMIKHDILFTYKNLEKTNRAIKMGMYDEELNELQTQIKMAQLDWGEDVWGM